MSWTGCRLFGLLFRWLAVLLFRWLAVWWLAVRWFTVG